MFHTCEVNGTVIPVESNAEPFVSIDGTLKVPMGPWLGVNIDPEYIKTHEVVSL